jgi:hypothetical protein
MSGVTAFGLLLTPVFYVALRKMADYMSRPPRTVGDASLPEQSHA